MGQTYSLKNQSRSKSCQSKGFVTRKISNGSNTFIADTSGAVGEIWSEVKDRPNVLCPDVSAGMTEEAYDLMSRKVLDNIERYLKA